LRDLEQAGLIKRVPPRRAEALEQLVPGRRDLRIVRPNPTQKKHAPSCMVSV